MAGQVRRCTQVVWRLLSHNEAVTQPNGLAHPICMECIRDLSSQCCMTDETSSFSVRHTFQWSDDMRSRRKRSRWLGLYLHCMGYTDIRLAFLVGPSVEWLPSIDVC